MARAAEMGSVKAVVAASAMKMASTVTTTMATAAMATAAMATAAMTTAASMTAAAAERGAR